MVKNKKTGPDMQDGFWEAPKGHMEFEDGGDPLKAAFREVLEETGVDLHKF